MSARRLDTVTKQLANRVEELARDYHADFLQLDQIGAAGGFLCFDSNHGHSTPALAWTQGYTRLLTLLRDIGRTYNSQFWVWIEGAWELAGQHADGTQGGMWPFHPTAQRLAEVYHFTMPGHLVFGDAMFGGLPFWQGGLKNPAVVLLKKHAAFFSRSRFMSTFGLEYDNDVIDAVWYILREEAMLVVRNKTDRHLSAAVILLLSCLNDEPTEPMQIEMSIDPHGATAQTLRFGTICGARNPSCA